MEATFTKSMKRISLMAVAMILFGVQSVLAQVNGDFRSKQSGDWNDFTTWQVYNGGWSDAVFGETPSASSSVFIENGHDVTVNTGTRYCKDLNISITSAPLTKASLEVGSTGSANLFINGRLKGYTGSVSNGTLTISDAAPANLSTTINGVLTVDGTISRNLINSGEWNATATDFDLIIAPGAGVQLTLADELAVKNLFVISGTLIAGTNTVFVEEDVSIEGEFISSANTVISKINGSDAGTLTLTNTGELAFTGVTPSVQMTSMDLVSGTVYYQMAGADQNIMVEDGDGTSLVYGNLILKNSTKVIPLTKILKVTGLLSIESNGILELNTGILELTDNATVTGAGTIDADPSAEIKINGTGTGNTTVPLKFVTSDELGKLTLNRSAMQVNLASPLTLTNNLTLTEGNIVTTSNTLTLKDQVVTVTGGTNTSYVDGPLARKIDSNLGNQPIKFPIGKNNVYLPMTLDIAQTGTEINTYVANLIPSPLGNPSNLPSGVTHVSGVRYFTVTQSGTATITNADITLTFAEDDGVDGLVSKLTILSSNGGNWVNLGNGASQNNGESGGFITSANDISNFATFVLANTSDVVGERNSLNNTTLPIELVSFDANLRNGQVQLNWATSTEINNDRFVIERSADGIEFASVLTVKGKGNSNHINNYTGTDKQPLNGISYYRLKQVDFDGTVTYSKVVSVSSKGSFNVISVYPNPATDNITISFPSEIENVQVSITNLVGQTVVSKQINNNSDSKATINVADLPAGTYQLKVTSTQGSTVVKFVKSAF